ncbi:MAG: hypothetical protein ACRC1M_00205 [Methanobacteriaceae archaeon]
MNSILNNGGDSIILNEKGFLSSFEVIFGVLIVTAILISVNIALEPNTLSFPNERINQYKNQDQLILMSSDSYYGELSTLEFIANRLNTNGNTKDNMKYLTSISESFFEKSGISKYYFGFKYTENSEDSNNNNNNNGNNGNNNGNVKSWKDGEIVEIASKGDITTNNNTNTNTNNNNNIYSSSRIIGNYIFIFYTN